MSGKVIWKFLVTGAVLLWALSNLNPIKDIPFEDHMKERVSVDKAIFSDLLDRAKEDVEAGSKSLLYMAIADRATTEGRDLTEIFTDILPETKNLSKKNEIVMRTLLYESRGKLKLGLDMKGGVAVTLEIAEDKVDEMNDFERESMVNKVIEVMESRVNAFGVSEPVIRPVGDRAIEIQLPGDSQSVLESINKPAILEFRRAYTQLPPDASPIAFESLVMQNEDRATGEIVESTYFVKVIPDATGDIIDNSYPQLNDTGQWIPGMSFSDEGSEIFATVTRNLANDNRRSPNEAYLGIVLDGKLYSAPRVDEEIRGGGAVITGVFTQMEVMELVNVLNNPLSVPLVETQKYVVGPTLAAEAKEASIDAAKLGGILVIAFMVFYYYAAGIVAVITVLVNLMIVIGVLAGLGATMTLPGVAALVLTIGMAVDANILIFERIREELRAGKKLTTAVQSGFDKAFSTIVDANVTTLITATILVYMGTGPVKGFGVTLAVGIVTTVFCALILGRALVELIVESGLVKSMLQLQLFKPTNLDFQKYRKPAFLSSWLVVIAGMVMLYQTGDRAFGIDFLGGDEVTCTYVDRISVTDIEELAAKEELGEVIALYQTMLGNEEGNVLKLQTESGRGADVVDALLSAFPGAGLEQVGLNVIGASVSDATTDNAFWAIGTALIGILLYVALRFEMGYGVGAVVATVHDLLMTLGIFVMLGGQFSAPMVAAVLMILGYSINDTIVVFDRIREELELNPGASLKHIMNVAINRTLARTLLTSITTLLAAVSLYVFGAGVINDYAMVFIIGIFTGTFSSIFIASPVFYWWHSGDRRHVEEREFLPKYDWETGAK